MDYMALLTKVRESGQKAEEAKRLLMKAGRDNGVGKNIVRWKQQYMCCNGEYEQCKAEALQAIQGADDPEVMRALYFRRGKGMSRNEAYRKLCSSRSEIDLWLAVSQYLHTNYGKDWSAYSDCL